MNFDDPAQLLWGVGALVLALAALTARRPSLGAILRSLLSWIVIGALAYLAVTHRHELGAMLDGIKNDLGLQEQTVDGDTVRIRQSPDGHFWARVDLNGYQRRMLIDSGATMTALSKQTAARAGVETGGLPVLLTTANGTIPAARGRVQRLTIGGLDAHDLPVVVSASFGDFDVLGMNFLSRLASWRVEKDTLILEPQHKAARN